MTQCGIASEQFYLELFCPTLLSLEVSDIYESLPSLQSLHNNAGMYQEILPVLLLSACIPTDVLFLLLTCGALLT